MGEDQAQPVGPDLALGVPANELPDGAKPVGHVVMSAEAAVAWLAHGTPRSLRGV